MKQVFFILFMLIANVSLAQEDSDHKIINQAVSSLQKENTLIAVWTVSKEKGKNENEYIITANVKLAEHWHIFDFEPGGDGLLIAPEFIFESEEIEVLGQEALGEKIVAEIEGFGSVNYYEKEVSFKVSIRTNIKEIKGAVYYQLCDHEKCMAPTEEAFYLN